MRLSAIVAWIILGTGSAAAAKGPEGARPLLVAVEIAPGSDCTAADVRRAVGLELDRKVVAPTLSPPDQEADMLVIVVERDRIVATFLERPEGKVSRTIPVGADRATKLRMISWLAGNMARDQTAPFVAPLPTTQEAALPEKDSPTKPGENTRLSTEPPPMPSAPVLAPAAISTEEGVALKASTLVAPGGTTPWTFSVAMGPAAMLRTGTGLSYASSWQLDVQHHRSGGGIYGLALSAGPDPDHVFGLAALMGKGRRLSRWMLEGTAGAGIEAIGDYHATTTMTTNSSLTGTTSETVVRRAIQAALFLQGTLGLGVAVSPSFDLFTRVGARVASTGFPHDAFVNASVGLRLKLP